VDESLLSVLPADVHMPNGMTLGHDGHLVVCEQGTLSEHARISRVDPVTGQVEGLVDGWGGLRLNSPNDVAARRDGTIWFTDPGYGYRRMLAFDVRHGTHLAGGRLFAVTTPGFPDGLKADPAGRVYASSPSGVQVFAALNTAAGTSQRHDQAPERW